MSYDINLVRVPPGADPEAVADASVAMDEEAQLNPGEPDSTKEQIKRRLAAALQTVNPLLTAFPFDYSDLARLEKITEQEARRRFRHIELNGPDDGNGIQITLFDDTATITIPYWHHGQKAQQALQEIWSYLEIFERDAGFRAYDPQLEHILSLRRDFNVVLAKYGEGVGFTDRVAADVTNPSRPERPWWRFW